MNEVLPVLTPDLGAGPVQTVLSCVEQVVKSVVGYVNYSGAEAQNVQKLHDTSNIKMSRSYSFALRTGARLTVRWSL